MERPECKVSTNGTREWYLHGKMHREDGPAIEDANGSRGWYLNGKRHREDGPAVDWANGTRQWFLHGMKLTFKQWCANLSVNDTLKTLLLLKYSDELNGTI